MSHLIDRGGLDQGLTAGLPSWSVAPEGEGSTMRRYRLLPTLLLAAAGSWACGGSGDPRESQTEAHQAPIWNGQDDADSARNNVVVSLRNGTGGNICTGTLISSTLVLTANHCVNSRSCKAVGGVGLGTLVQVGADASAFKSIRPDASDATARTVSRVVKVDTSLMNNAPTDCQDDTDSDLALLDIYPPIVIEAYAMRPTLAPLPHLDGTEVVRVVGWGLTQSGSPPHPPVVAARVRVSAA